MRRATVLSVMVVAAVSGAVAEDKGQYHLFRATPRELMRELSTDRPDKTESAYTVDAGHFQVELDVVNYTREGDDDAWGIGFANLKAGLLNNVDLQVVIESFLKTEDARGFGDVTTRVKINLWGNDGGPTALAVMPFVKWPTNGANLGNDAVEGGVIVPLAVELPAAWGMGVMTEFDINEDGDGRGYHVEFINSITFAHDIAGDLGGYVEFFSAVSTEGDADWVGTVDVGLTYAVNDDVQLDTGINIGVTDAADDLSPFVGVSVRY